MAFTDLEMQLIDKIVSGYCKRRSPDRVRDKLEIRYRLDGQAVTIVERRPKFQMPGEFTETTVARFRYTRTSGLWTLYWADRNSKWHVYERTRPTRDLKLLIAEVERDPTGIFWG